MQPVWKPPAYVIVVPQVFSANSDDETSEGEEVDNTFPEEYFKEPPFEIDWKARGTVTSRDILSTVKKVEAYKSTFFEKVEQETFNGDCDEAVNRVGVVVGHNRMLSLCTSLNGKLLNQRKRYVDTPLENREIYFFWRPKWINTKTRKVEEWGTVRKFYDQLKKKDSVKARRFRKDTEGVTDISKKALAKYFTAYTKTEQSADEFCKSYKATYFTRRHVKKFEGLLKNGSVKNVEEYLKKYTKALMIPYREIRETIKNHSKTKECVEAIQEGQDRPTYMAFQDADVESMEGLFANYDSVMKEHLEKHKVLPEVASGGYNIKAPQNPILEIGVLIDLWIRHYTAMIIQRGVYYPEPNTLVKLNDDASTLEASFLGKKTTYTSPQEMPTLIQDLIEKRKITNLSGAFLFNATAALTTAIPERMNRSFKAHYTEQNKVVRWGLGDLKIYKAVSQTHYCNRGWAINICDAIGASSELEYENKRLPTNVARNMAISLVCRLFASYDPFEIARRIFESAREPKIGFQKTMNAVLKNYNPDTLPLGPKEERSNEGAHAVLWKELDDISEMDLLLLYIDWLLAQDGIGREIQSAAQLSMQAVAQIYQENLSLDFIELSIAAMMTLDKPRDLLDKLQRDLYRRKILTVDEIGPPAHQMVLNTMIESGWIGRNDFKKMSKELAEDQREGYLGTYPMHWAAITGNLEAIEFLKSCKSWVSAVDPKGTDGLLPLHCAIRYCADNGENLNLIEALATEDLVKFCPIRMVGGIEDELETLTSYKVLRESPLLQALEELPQYPQTLRLLFRIAKIPEVVQNELLELTKEFNEAEESELEPKKILAIAIQLGYSPRVIEHLLFLGANFHSCQDQLERKSPYAAVIDDDYRNEADRLTLLKILHNMDHDLLLKDSDDLTPLQYALEMENLPVVEELLSYLLKEDYKPSEEEEIAIEALRKGIRNRIRREEPLHPEMAEDLQTNIQMIKMATNLTDKEKEKLIASTEKLLDSFYYYTDEILANVQRQFSSRKRRFGF